MFPMFPITKLYRNVFLNGILIIDSDSFFVEMIAMTREGTSPRITILVRMAIFEFINEVVIWKVVNSSREIPI